MANTVTLSPVLPMNMRSPRFMTLLLANVKRFISAASPYVRRFLSLPADSRPVTRLKIDRACRRKSMERPASFPRASLRRGSVESKDHFVIEIYSSITPSACASPLNFYSHRFQETRVTPFSDPVLRTPSQTADMLIRASNPKLVVCSLEAAIQRASNSRAVRRGSRRHHSLFSRDRSFAFPPFFSSLSPPCPPLFFCSDDFRFRSATRARARRRDTRRGKEREEVDKEKKRDKSRADTPEGHLILREFAGPLTPPSVA